MAFGSQLNVQVNAQAALAILGDLAASLGAAGTSQGTATAITTANWIATTVGAGSGVVLPVSPTVSAKDTLFGANHGVNTLAVYPPNGGKLGTASANAPLLLAPGKAALFFCIDGINYAVLVGA